MDLKVETNPENPKPTRPQPSPLNHYARTVASEARRFRQGITRENVAAFLKNMAWTIPLTILIWVYAEREQEVQATDQPIAIKVTSRDRSRTVTLDSKEMVIMCDLKGPRSNLDRFREALSTSVPVTIDLDTRQLADDKVDTIPTLENIRENARIKEAGITIEKCTPPTLSVTVDTLEKRKLPVAAPPSIVGVSVTFDPASVDVEGPSRVVEHLGQVTADIGALPILNETGPHPPVKVLLVPDVSGALKYSPSDVEATLTVQEKDQTFTCTNVPVWFDLHPSIANGYSITCAGSVPNVQVIGPPEQIDKLRRHEQFPRAVLEIGPDNVDNTNPVSLRIEDLPKDVRIDGPNPQITFTATRK